MPRTTVTRPLWIYLLGLGALALVGLNLRLALAVISPLMPAIRADYGLSAAAAGLAMTVAVLMFGVLAPLTPKLVARYGPDRVLVTGLALVCLGAFVRSMPGSILLYGGMAILGAGIALMNVVMPVIVKRDFAGHVSVATSVYTAALNIGSATVAAGAVPLALAMGGWQPAIAMVIIPALLAGLLWWAWAPGRGLVNTPSVRLSTLVRDPVALQVTGYMLLQSLLYYVLLSWLPTIYADQGVSAESSGFLLAIAQLGQLIACLFVPLITRRMRDQRVAAGGFAVLTTVAFLGLSVAPLAAPILWTVILGLGQGGALTIALMLIVVRSPDAPTAASLSGFAQGIGYSLAAFGPIAVGALHDLMGGWTFALAIMTCLCVVELWVGIFAGRNRFIKSSVVTEQIVRQLQ